MSSIISPVTFHHPRFDKNIKDKIGICLQVDSEHAVSQIKTDYAKGKHAIASSGIDSNVDGTHVFVTRIDNIGDTCIRIGWTGEATSDSASYDCPGYQFGGGVSGFALLLESGRVRGSNNFNEVADLSENITQHAKDVVSILKISDNGRKKTVQFIVDGHEGTSHDVTKCFENKNECFPIMILNAISDAKVTTIPFPELKSTSPIIEELKKKMNQHALLPPSSTNNEENEKLIAELRREVDEGNRRLLKQKDEQIEEMKNMFRQQLEMKDRQMKELLEMKEKQTKEQLEKQEQHLNSNERMLQRSADEKKQIEKQLELERAEHQKTRNLLHQKTTEMKDMEIHFLKEQNKLLQKESGQRRERENADEFQVKKERED